MAILAYKPVYIYTHVCACIGIGMGGGRWLGVLFAVANMRIAIRGDFPPYICVCVYVHVCMYKDTHAQRRTFMLTSVLRWQSLVGTVKREAGLFNYMNYIIIIVLHKDLTIRYTVESKCIL